MKLFSRKGRAVRNWHERAMMIDPKKTRLTIVQTKGMRNIPSWAYKKFSLPQMNE